MSGRNGGCSTGPDSLRCVIYHLVNILPVTLRYLLRAEGAVETLDVSILPNLPWLDVSERNAYFFSSVPEGSAYVLRALAAVDRQRGLPSPH